MTKNHSGSVFATDHMTSEEVATLIEIGVPLMDENGKVPWAKVEGATGIGYGRGWLIVRRAYLEQKAPGLVVDIATKLAEGAEKAQGDDTYDPMRRVWGPIVSELRDTKKLSWGEIAVRLGCPESKVRAAYKANGNKMDRGLRIGKGGRFVYGDPTLYLDNRKAEGAYIPNELKRRPKVEDLLNFKPDARDTSAATKGKAMKRVWDLIGNMNGRTEEEVAAFTAKAEELCAKYNFTLADVRRWAESKGKRV